MDITLQQERNNEVLIPATTQMDWASERRLAQVHMFLKNLCLWCQNRRVHRDRKSGLVVSMAQNVGKWVTSIIIKVAVGDKKILSVDSSKHRALNRSKAIALYTASFYLNFWNYMFEYRW